MVKEVADCENGGGERISKCPDECEKKGLSMFRRVHSDDYGGAWCPGPNLDQCYCICVMDKNPGSCIILTTSTQFGMHLNKIDL